MRKMNQLCFVLLLLVLLLFNVYSLVCSYRYKNQRDDCLQVYTNQQNMNPAQYDYSLKIGLLNNGKQLSFYNRYSC